MALRNDMTTKLITALLRYYAQCRLHAPTILNARYQRLLTYSNHFRPLTHWLFLPPECKKVIVSLVPSLNRPSHPPTVSNRIISVVVDAIKRSALLPVLQRVRNIALVHIVSKIFKAFPLTAHASTAIVFIRRFISILTPSNYPAPRLVKPRPSHPMLNNSHIVAPLQARRIGRSVPAVAPMLLMTK